MRERQRESLSRAGTPCTARGPTCRGQSPTVTRADQSRVIPSRHRPSPSKYSRGGKAFHGLSPWGLVSLRGGRAEANKPEAGLGTSTPGWELHPSQCQPVILTNTEPVPSTFILLRKHLIGIQSQSLLSSPTSCDLCDVFVFRHCCQQYPFSGKAADACRFPKVSLMDTLSLLKDNRSFFKSRNDDLVMLSCSYAQPPPQKREFPSPGFPEQKTN